MKSTTEGTRSELEPVAVSALTGRADLLRAMALREASVAEAVADTLGYERLPLVTVPSAMPQAAKSSPVAAEAPTSTPDSGAPLAPVTFWRAEKLSVIEPVNHLDEMPDDEPPPREAVTVEFEPLASFAEVFTRIRHESGLRRPGKRPDVKRIVAELSRCRELRRIPKLTRRVWGVDLHVIIDRARRLTPYWRDQDLLRQAFSDRLPAGSADISLLPEGQETPRGLWPKANEGEKFCVSPGSAILVVGDLGVLSDQNSQQIDEWVRRGRAWREQGCSLLALVPCRVDHLPADLLKLWSPILWERASKLPPTPSPGDTERAVDRLITLLSRAVRIEPRLLRSIRRLFPEGARDCGLEARFWQRADLTRHSTAASFSETRLREFRAQLAGDPLAEAAFDRIRAAHRGEYEGIHHVETLNLGTGFPELASRHERAQAAAWFARKEGEQVQFFLQAGQQLSTEAAVHPIMNQLSREYRQGAMIEGYDPALSGADKPIRSIHISQDGELWQADTMMSGQSPLGRIRIRDERMVLRETIEARIPGWVSRWGRDRFGTWADFALGGVVQRMRWIEPGLFMMGSPDGEEGRWGDEGPQHPVEIEQGFWMFDTPCTQALWMAVMGKNPSRFQGEDRPVENVSWEDANAFIAKLNERLAGLNLELPAEAPWEYACRASTIGARYQDEVTDIAWFNENSDRETHPVKLKLPNRWGLFDMLGNVYEWCSDKWRASYANVADDTTALQVIRGGGWGGGARGLRAAARYLHRPSDARDYLGFRCLSSGASPAGWQSGVEPSEQAERGEAERSRARVMDCREGHGSVVAPTASVIILRSDLEELTLRQIERPGRQLEAQGGHCHWASDMGRDEFGLWAELTIGSKHSTKVIQRLRWIPPGRFWYGCKLGDNERFLEDVERTELVVSKGFWIFDSPCTRELWFAVMRGKPKHRRGLKEPIANVNWYACSRFAEQLSDLLERSKVHVQLPDEVRWEYACRAGTEESRYSTNLDKIAWYEVNSGNHVQQIKQKQPNPWGLFDMLGNVLEWCKDERLGAPQYRVVRGGGWGANLAGLRACARASKHVDNSFPSLGFRCIIDDRTV